MDELILSSARRAYLQVSIGGHDATSYLEAYVKSFEYIDHESGKADELRLTLHDRDGKWSGEWRPSLGTKIEASFTVLNWEGGGAVLFPCGEFSVDEVEFSGVPDEVTIKALSAALTSELRDTTRTQAWENYTLRDVAAEIAQRNGLSLMYSAPDHAFERRDQREESDLAFVQRLASSYAVKCKIHNGKLVLFDAADADSADPVLTVKKRGGQFSPTRYRFLESSSDTGYSRAVVSYTDPSTGKVQKAEVKVRQEGSAEKELTLNSRVESASEAMALGKSQLRQKNEKTFTAELELMGHPSLVSGSNIELSGFGCWDGVWAILEARHRLHPAYAVQLKIRKALEY